VSADLGRAEVYAAELEAFDGTDLEVVVAFDEAAALAARVMSDPWWSAPRVPVLPARSDAHSSSTRARAASQTVIRLAAPQCTAATVVHELAHVLAGVAAGHGPSFRRAHVDIATVAFGADRSAWLLDAYERASLQLGPRAWPPPPPPAVAIAL
jgi:hypothetical protein